MCLTKLFDGKGKEHQLDSDKIGELAQLKTSAKGNLVEAVNEVNDSFPKVEEADNGKILRVENGRWAAVEQEESSFGAPMFDLGAMGMAPLPATGGQSSAEMDTSELSAALDAGAVKFAIPFTNDEDTFPLYFIMSGATDGNGTYICSTMYDTNMVGVLVQPDFVYAVMMPLSDTVGLPSVTGNDDGKIMQVVDGSWSAVPVADSSVKTFVDEYISSALEGDY